MSSTRCACFRYRYRFYAAIIKNSALLHCMMVTLILELPGTVHVIAWLTFFIGLSNSDQRHTKFMIFKYSLSIKFLQDAETVTKLLSLPESNSQRPKFYNFRCLHSEMQEWTMQLDRQLRSSPKRSNLWKNKWPGFRINANFKDWSRMKK